MSGAQPHCLSQELPYHDYHVLVSSETPIWSMYNVTLFGWVLLFGFLLRCPNHLFGALFRYVLHFQSADC